VRRKLVALLLCLIPVALQTQSSTQKFTSADGAFSFKYSPNLIHCVQQNGIWSPAEACSAREEVCESESGLSHTLACFAYPKSAFTEKPAFSAAVFFVAEIQQATSEQPCLDGEDWLPESNESTEINGLRFKVFHTNDSWTNGARTADIYRTFHGKCYELGVQGVHEIPVGLKPGTFKEFSKSDQQMVQRALNEALKSFRFLK
jgi:hypothetical protein